MENAEVAQTLAEMADALEVLGEDGFRARAYRRAAQAVDTLTVPVADLVAAGTVGELPGVGAHIAARIGELVQTGRCREHDRLAGRLPEGLLEMLQIEGLGPKGVAAIWKELGVHDVTTLEAACRDGSILGVSRMGETRAKALLAAIERHAARRGRTLLHRALPFAEAVAGRLRGVRGVERAEVAGSVRRRCETVADIDVLVASTDPERAVEAFSRLPDAREVLARGPTKCVVRLRAGIQVDLRVLPPESFGAALVYFTGSKLHAVALRRRAQRMGFKVNEYGVFDGKDRRIAGRTEEEVYRAVGLPWIPPELREDAGELEAAERGRLPRLVEEGDLRGDLHVHSDTSSDGRSSLSELAAQARRLGLSYLAITDHSRSRPLGLTAKALAGHVARVRAMQGGPALLAGIEVDILADGGLDLPPSSLAALDVVVASVHSRFRDPREKMTARMLRAVRSGVVDVLGHPSGRQIGSRDPYDYDLDAVLRAAREEGVALEVNAQPDRLDLSDHACRRAREAGVLLAIDSDAHHASQLGNVRYGVWVARRGWIERSQVINAQPEAAARAFLRRRHRPRPVREPPLHYW